jgi:predicted SAM-dependent methyltransferase
LLHEAGFRVRLLEWWDESGRFHREPWSVERGHIQRSAEHDKRNADGELHYTSLIVDGEKP